MISVEHLRKKYRSKIAVDDISFTVKTGKVTGFLGPNGAGKSTTMRLMLGLDQGQGLTKYDGKRLNEYSRPSRVVGVLLEAKAFHPTRTAKRHLSVLASAGNVPQSRVKEVLDTVGLTDVANKPPGKFSLGMAQRLGIAAAILGKPKYLILDEPANGLDPEGIVWLREFLKDYAKNGQAVFVSSHLLSELSQMVDDIVVIGRGKLLANTSVDELVASKGRSTVFVRADNLAKLEKVLRQKDVVFKKEDGGFKVSGLNTDKVGKMVFEAGLPVVELTNQSATLEDIFLDITEGSEEFLGPNQKRAKK